MGSVYQVMTDTPAVAARADARRNRQRLLDVAHRAFLDGGVGASMDDIARRAGVGIGTLYRHFPSRDALVLALVADDLDRLAGLADAWATDDASGSVEEWLGELVTHNLTYRGLAEAITSASGTPTPLGAACDRIHRAGAALVRRAQDRGSIRTDVNPGDAIDLASAIAWATEHDDDATRRDRMMRVVIDGLRVSP